MPTSSPLLRINGAIAGLAYHGIAANVAKGAVQVWGATDYITATGSADSSGLQGPLVCELREGQLMSRNKLAEAI